MYVSNLKKYLYLSQATLFVCLLICSLIIPSVLIKNGGVSNFGNHLNTVVFYVLGFLSNIVFIYLVAEVILKFEENLVYIARGFMLLSFLTFVVLISTFPRHFSFTFSVIHDYLGIALFSYYIIISIWIVLKQYSPLALALLSIEAIGSTIGLLSTLKITHLLFVGQIIGALGFGLLLCIVFPKIINNQLKFTKV
jgi:hypothetical protein